MPTNTDKKDSGGYMIRLGTVFGKAMDNDAIKARTAQVSGIATDVTLGPRGEQPPAQAAPTVQPTQPEGDPMKYTEDVWGEIPQEGGTQPIQPPQAERQRDPAMTYQGELGDVWGDEPQVPPAEAGQEQAERRGVEPPPTFEGQYEQVQRAAREQGVQPIPKGEFEPYTTAPTMADREKQRMNQEREKRLAKKETRLRERADYSKELLAFRREALYYKGGLTKEQIQLKEDGLKLKANIEIGKIETDIMKENTERSKLMKGSENLAGQVEIDWDAIEQKNIKIRNLETKKSDRESERKMIGTMADEMRKFSPGGKTTTGEAPPPTQKKPLQSYLKPEAGFFPGKLGQ